MKQGLLSRTILGSALALAQVVLLMGPVQAARGVQHLGASGDASLLVAPAAPAAPVANQANLQISASAASATVVVPAPGQIQYNVVITNTGPDAAQNVQVILSLTSVNYWGYASISGGTAPVGWSCATALDGHSRTCSRAADMPTSTAEALTFLVTPNRVGVFSGAYAQFTASASSEDPNTSNNLDTPEDVTVTSSITSADMSAEAGAFTLQDGSAPASIPAGSLAYVLFGGRNNGAGVMTRSPSRISQRVTTFSLT